MKREKAMRKNKFLLKSAAGILSLMMMGSVLPQMDLKAADDSADRKACEDRGSDYTWSESDKICIKSFWIWIIKRKSNIRLDDHAIQ